MKNQAPRQNAPQSGSIMFMIFIMIGLFAALSYALSQGLRTGTTELTDNQTRLAASELIAYAQQARDTYKKLRINGCAAGQISFKNPVYGTNATYFPDPASAPADESCHLFSPKGGGLNYMDFTKIQVLPQTYKGFTYASVKIDNAGTDKPEEMLVMAGLSKNVCEQINFQINQQKTVFTHNNFGERIDSGDELTASRCPACSGRPIGCAYDSAHSPTSYNFYYTLESN